MWGSENFVQLSTKQKNQWFKLRLWTKTEYLRMEGYDVKIDESEYPGSTIQSKWQCTGEMKKRVQAGWTGWRDAAETHDDGRFGDDGWVKTGGWAGDAQTEQDYKYQGDGSHWRWSCRAGGKPQKEVHGCSEGGCRGLEWRRRMLKMQPKQDDVIQISDFTYLL